MKQQRIHKVQREKEKLRKEFREMMISIGNSLSAGYSIENALKTAKNDLEMYEEHSLLAKELQLLINKLKMNEPVDKLLFVYGGTCGSGRILSVCTGHINCEKKWWESDRDHGKYDRTFKSGNPDKRRDSHDDRGKNKWRKKIMSVMPYFILLYVRIANPGYFDILYESFAGVLVAVISLLCLWIADIWAERVTEIEI